MRQRTDLYLVGGIRGLQAYSTEVVTKALSAGLRDLGWRCRQVELVPGWIPRQQMLRWLVESLYRYLIYPVWCRRAIPVGSLVYVTDHANAGVVRCLRNGCFTGVHVHDLTSLRPPWDFPYPLRVRNLLIWLLSLLSKRAGIRAADRLVAISEFTAKELTNYLNIEADRVAVIYNGIDHDTFYPVSRAGARRRADLPQDGFIVMTLGPASYRKNTLVIAEALATLSESERPALWIHVGELDGLTLQAIRKTGLESGMRLFKKVNNSDLRDLYASASVFISASLYEGFGLPPLEAMACGTPVIASDIPASREILADQVQWFQPNASADLARVLKASRVQIANKTADELNQFTRQYSWEAACRKLDQLLAPTADKNVESTDPRSLSKNSSRREGKPF